MQWLVVNTLFQEKKQHHNRKDGYKGTPKIGPVLEVRTSYLHGKHGVEIRIMSLSRDNTHSWVRISHGSNKFVMDLNNNDSEILEDQLGEQALQLSVKDFAYRSKAKEKPQRRELADSKSSSASQLLHFSMHSQVCFLGSAGTSLISFFHWIHPISFIVRQSCDICMLNDLHEGQQLMTQRFDTTSATTYSRYPVQNKFSQSKTHCLRTAPEIPLSRQFDLVPCYRGEICGCFNMWLHLEILRISVLGFRC